MSMPCARRCTGLRSPNLTGGIAVMLPNHHLTKPVLIGEIRADGQFDIISQTEPVPGDAWTDFLPESAVLEADWQDLGCGMYNTADQDLRADPRTTDLRPAGARRGPLPFPFPGRLSSP
jgi:hypothetical protein